ncbi:MAG TPA: TraR/DksA C4-type zinc finger protein [Blastocatellia bacterium]|nr:TraR/DksA C4-type zinc finger protein [Blastocatellia bacterium]
MQEYHAIKQQLITRSDEIRHRLERITSDVRHVNQPLAADFEEQVVERENDQVLDALNDSIRAELAQIEGTLGRLDRGEYGVCEVCGRRIPIRRLEVLPHASRCVVCAEKG